MIDIAKCILHINPNAVFICWENDYNRVIYEAAHVGVKPTLAECEAAWDEIQAMPEIASPTIEERVLAMELLIPLIAEAQNV